MTTPDVPAHPTLLSAITVGPLTLRNRLVMGSMHIGMEDRAKHIGELTAYFAERARGGAGLIVTGGFSPNVKGWLLPAGSSLRSKRMAKWCESLADAVHAEHVRRCGRDLTVWLGPSPLVARDDELGAAGGVSRTNMRSESSIALWGGNRLRVAGVVAERCTVREGPQPRTRWGGAAAA